MKPPFPFPFGNQKKSGFDSALKDFIRAIDIEDLQKPRVMAELDQVHDSLMAMASDQIYADSAIALEIKLVNQLHDLGSGNFQVKTPLVIELLKRYRHLDYGICARATATLEAACKEKTLEEVFAIKELSLSTARKVVNDTSWDFEYQYFSWGTDVKNPMFDKAMIIAIYLVDPELLGIHKGEYERYFALRHTEMAPKWKKLCAQARALLMENEIEHTPYQERIADILSRHDWVRPREVQLALSMMNTRFNYAEVIEAWPDKPAMLDKMGVKLLSYTNKQPWIAPYALMMAHLSHSMDLKGGHDSISNLIRAIMLPQHLHREDAGQALRSLSSLEGRLDPEGARLLNLATEMRNLDPLSKTYYQVLRQEGFGNQAYRFLKAECKVRGDKNSDSSKLIKLLRETGLDQHHRVPDKVRDHAMSIDLGL